MSDIKTRSEITVVIVNWNTRDLMLQCVRSIREKTELGNVEIIVVDNASSDGSLEALKNSFSDVIAIGNIENEGYGKAANKGIKRARGKYACLLNTDIELENDCLKIISRLMNEHENTAVVGPKLLNANGSLQLSCRRLPGLWNFFCNSFYLDRLMPFPKLFGGEHMTWFDHDSQIEVESLVGAFLAIRVEAFKQVGGFDEQFFMYSEETDFCKMVQDKGWKIEFCPEVRCFHYSGSSSSIDPGRFYKERFISKYRYWKKHMSRLSCITFLFIIFFRQMIKIIMAMLLAPFKVGSHGRRKGSIKGSVLVLRWLAGGAGLEVRK
jgi:GT2 family glycosyltransferase